MTQEEYKVTLVPKEHVLTTWPDVEPYMERAIQYTAGRYLVQDALALVTDYDHTLWIAYNVEGICGAVITGFVEYPRKRTLQLVFCAGDEGMKWKQPMLKILQCWGFDNGCDAIEATARAGWLKIFQDDDITTLWQAFELPVASEGLGVAHG